MSEKHRITLALFAIALGLRIAFAVLIGTGLDGVPNPNTPDLAYARHISSGLQWLREPISPRAPGYPVALASMVAVSLGNLWLVVVIQAALGAVTVLIVHRLGTAFLGPLLGVVAALWLALDAHQMRFASLFHRDMFTALLLVLMVFFVQRRFTRMRFAVVAGGVCAALVHVDPQFVFLVPLFGVYIMIFKTHHRILSIQYFFVFAMTTFVLSLPWTIRNHLVYGQPIPVALEARPYFRPVKELIVRPDEALEKIEGRIMEVSRTRRIERNSLEFWRFAKWTADPPPDVERGVAYWPAAPAWSLRHNLISIASYGLLLPFLVVGVVFVFRDRNRTGILLFLTTLLYFAIRAYFGGGERARFAVQPFIILLAFYGILVLIRKFKPAWVGGGRADEGLPAGS